MSVTCACDYGYDGGSWWYEHDREFTVLKTRKRRRCWSCNELIDIGAECGILSRFRAPLSDVEESIYIDIVPLAPAHLCEECYGLLLSVEEAGGCVLLEKGERLKDAVAEWRQDYPEGCGS